MKFIRLANENYLNVADIKTFCLTFSDTPELRAVERNGDIHAVARFKSRWDAETYLRGLVDRINAEETS